jgi:sodium-dependent dicarboxylate transporter 2/3/5
MPKVLLVDDETTFRENLRKRLTLRGYDTIDVTNGEDAIKAIRADGDIDVVVLDRKMPGMEGEQVLREMKDFRPEIQVIMLTGHGTMESAMETGKLEAYSYLAKPCELEDLVKVIDQAREDKVHVMARHEIPHVEKGSTWSWLKGSHNSRPGVIMLGAILFCLIVFLPAPDRLMHLVSSPKTGELSDPNLGYASYRKMADGENIAHYYGKTYHIGENTTGADGKRAFTPASAEQAASKARVMLGILVVAALFWATGAVPVGITSLAVGLGMYFGGVLQPDDIAQAYAKDAVIFIFGVLAMSLAISKTGLDRRIGLLLLGPAKSLPRMLFIFLPLLGVACSFVSEHALIAFIMPLIMMVYVSSIRAAGLKRDRALVVMFVLSMCYVANCGGPGSPAAGGRNAVMLGILSDYGIPPSFGEWVQYGLPFVPVMALVIAAYFYIVFRRKIAVKQLNISSMVHQASEKIGPMNAKEYITAASLVVLILLWVLASDKYGMGGPVILILIALNIFRVIGHSLAGYCVDPLGCRCALRQRLCAGKGTGRHRRRVVPGRRIHSPAARVHAQRGGSGDGGQHLHRPGD